MDAKVNAIREFLESIPQFIRDLDIEDEYLKISDDQVSLRYPQDFNVVELEDAVGFKCTGFMAPDKSDLVQQDDWHTLMSEKNIVDQSVVYREYLNAHPALRSDFDLKEFLDLYSDFYFEFLNEAGIDEDDVEIDDNSFIYNGAVVSDDIPVPEIDSELEDVDDVDLSEELDEEAEASDE